MIVFKVEGVRLDAILAALAHEDAVNWIDVVDPFAFWALDWYEVVYWNPPNKPGRWN